MIKDNNNSSNSQLNLSNGMLDFTYSSYGRFLEKNVFMQRNTSASQTSRDRLGKISEMVVYLDSWSFNLDRKLTNDSSNIELDLETSEMEG